MLIQCPECGLNVSEKALVCPHCGYPIAKPANIKRQKTKLKKLPNGFGRITKITSKPLRKPFRVIVTIGHDVNGRPIGKVLKPEGYFETYNDAYAALVEYQRNPYDLEDDVTVEDLYKRWSEHHFSTLKSNSSKRTIESAWSYCSEIYKIRVKDLRARHIKGVIDNGFKMDKKKGKLYPSASIKYRIKSMFNLMLDYAVEYEIVDKNYARTFEIPKDIIDEKEESRKEHIIFTEEEINILWENVDNTQYADWVLIQCYMGWRPQELGLIELKNISIENLTITGGMKSTSGKMRIVPIHHRIIPLIKKNIKIAESLGSKYLLNDKNKTKAKSNTNNYFINYDKYSDRFAKVIKELDLNPNHKAHDPRMTFVTRMKKAGADDGAIKKLVGHKNQDLTESVYTARDIEWLREDIEKME